ncbi:MAG: redox-regulated ATPase YchF [Desulfobacterales bacterium]|nr:redox-regulated ATPase YchF [Desulfobacterales bacterium]
MKLGIIGLTRSGKSTIFDALTRSSAPAGNRSENRIGTIQVPDSRIDVLSDMYNPRKTIYAQVEYFLPGIKGGTVEKRDQSVWTPVRDADALIHVIRNFSGYGFEAPTLDADFLELDQDLILTDQVSVEKRLERLALDKKRGRTIHPEEPGLLEKCLEALENEQPLRRIPEIAQSPVLRGFAFMSAKPKLVLFNNEDEDNQLPELPPVFGHEETMVIRAKLEQELGQMSPEEAAEFLAEFKVTASAMDRVVKRTYALQGLISFFTVGEDEVRAWTIRAETRAVDAADVIHSDIKKGFIRAEVVSYTDLMAAGSHAEARKKGTVRLEGKTYPVQDGDIINFRFNV